MKHTLLRRNLIIEANGEPAKQKDDLVKEILSTFAHPQKWPLTDSERCAILRKWYELATRIQDTEQAIQDAKD